jgi:uncharacterized protein YggT (Ycf19 family)
MVTFIFGYSLLIDIFWLIIIAWKTWFHPAYEKQVPWEHGVHMTTTVIVWINFLLKIISIVLSFFFDPKIKQTFYQTYQETLAKIQKARVY